jgi:hypothetical protein
MSRSSQVQFGELFAICSSVIQLVVGMNDVCVGPGIEGVSQTTTDALGGDSPPLLTSVVKIIATRTLTLTGIIQRMTTNLKELVLGLRRQF